MSTSLPPTGPPSGPPPGRPPGPPSGPPSGPPFGPPSGPPPSGPGPEYLEQGGGAPMPRRSGSGRKKGLIAGGALVGLGAVVVGGFFAWGAFFGTGPQPAEALPAGTLGYVSVDLDPSGSQKIEALRTLRKFPAFRDEIGLDTDDDIREKIFDEAQSSEACEGLDYADDVEPWLGDRFAVAAVDLGEETPTPVLVVQVKDAGQAEDGLQTLSECAGGDPEGGEDLGGWSIDGDWAVVAETDDIAQQVADDAAESPLSDDEDFTKWTGEAGDPGILTAYAAPEAGAMLAEQAGGFPLGGADVSCVAPSTPPDLGSDDPFDDGGFTEECLDGVYAPSFVPEELTELLEDFEGAAISVRFDDGALEIETASSLSFLGLDQLTASDSADEVIGTLPQETAAAFGVGFEEGWVDELIDYAAQFAGEEMDVDEIIAMAEAESGLSIPEDVETLAGDAAAISVGSDFDPETFFESSDGSDVPVGVKIKGDPEDIQGVLDKIVANGNISEEDAAILETDSDGDFVAFGPNADYRDELLEDGDLGGTDTYQDVIRESGDAGSILFVNFDAGDGWLANLAGGDPMIEENLKPLSGLGLSGWQDDGVGHTVFRVTTN